MKGDTTQTGAGGEGGEARCGRVEKKPQLVQTEKPGNTVEGQHGRLAVREGRAGVKTAIGASTRCTRLG